MSGQCRLNGPLSSIEKDCLRHFSFGKWTKMEAYICPKRCNTSRDSINWKYFFLFQKGLHLGLYLLKRRRLTGTGIPIISRRRSDDRLRFIMGIIIPMRRWNFTWYPPRRTKFWPSPAPWNSPLYVLPPTTFCPNVALATSLLPTQTAVTPAGGRWPSCSPTQYKSIEICKNTEFIHRLATHRMAY